MKKKENKCKELLEAGEYQKFILHMIKSKFKPTRKEFP